MSFQAPQPNDESYALVNEISDNTVAEAKERVWSHRFTRDLEAGTLPMEVIRGLILNLSTWAMEINATSEQFLIWLDQVYDTYDPRRPDHLPINGYQPPKKVRPSSAKRVVEAFLKRGHALAEKRILKHPFVRALERGLVTERPGWGVSYVGETSIRLWEMFLDGCKRHLMA